MRKPTHSAWPTCSSEPVPKRGRERREHPRAAYRGMVMVRCRNLSLSCGGVDISESGIRVHPSKEIDAPTAPLDLLLSLTSRGWIQLRARVRRVDAWSGGRYWALSFESPSKRSLEALRKVIAELLATQCSGLDELSSPPPPPPEARPAAAKPLDPLRTVEIVDVPIEPSPPADHHRSASSAAPAPAAPAPAPAPAPRRHRREWPAQTPSPAPLPPPPQPGRDSAPGLIDLALLEALELDDDDEPTRREPRGRHPSPAPEID